MRVANQPAPARPRPLDRRQARDAVDRDAAGGGRAEWRLQEVERDAQQAVAEQERVERTALRPRRARATRDPEHDDAGDLDETRRVAGHAVAVVPAVARPSRAAIGHVPDSGQLAADPTDHEADGEGWHPRVAGRRAPAGERLAHLGAERTAEERAEHALAGDPAGSAVPDDPGQAGERVQQHGAGGGAEQRACEQERQVGAGKQDRVGATTAEVDARTDEVRDPVGHRMREGGRLREREKCAGHGSRVAAI